MKKEGYVIARNKKHDEFFTASSAYDKARFVKITEATVYPTAQMAADAAKKIWTSGNFSATVVPLAEFAVELDPVAPVRHSPNPAAPTDAVSIDFSDEDDEDLDDLDGEGSVDGDDEIDLELGDGDVDAELDGDETVDGEACPPCGDDVEGDLDAPASDAELDLDPQHFEDETESPHPQRFRAGQKVMMDGQTVFVVSAPSDSDTVTVAANVSDANTYKKVSASSLKTQEAHEEEESAGQKRAGEHKWAMDAISKKDDPKRGHAWVRMMAGREAGKRYGPFPDPHRASEFKVARGFGKDAKVYVEDVEITEGAMKDYAMSKDKDFQTWDGWKRACKKHFPGCTFRGDKDIGACKHGDREVGEWDGSVGTIYGHELKENADFKEVEFKNPSTTADKPATDLTTVTALPHEEKINVPNHVKKALKATIAEFRDQVEFNKGYNDDKASFCMTVADAFQNILDLFDAGTVESFKQAQIRWGSYMNPITTHMPEDVVKFLMNGGRKSTLKDLFDVRWDKMRVKSEE